MSVLNENTIIGASAAGEYEIEQSLRFNDPNSPELVRTFGTATNRKVWTWSGWYKVSLGHGNDSNPIVTTEDGQAQNTLLTFGGHNATNTEKFSVLDWTSSEQFQLVTTALFRDPSAWYHIVVAYDSTQSTSSNRVKIYINGQQVTAFSREVYPPLNYETHLNSAIPTQIGSNDSRAAFFHGYMAETNFIDGQALTPDSFGKTGIYNEWKPIAYAGTYGNNGFYLPFEQDYAVEGFSTVVYEGNQNSSTYIGGTGFKPDLVWGKNRSSASNHWLFDSVRGTTKMLQADQTNAEETQTGVTAFSSDGFTLGTWIGSTKTGDDYVAWNWDMGGTTASNTNGSITTNVRANTTYGQSIVRGTYSGSGTQTFGHGLGVAPDLILGKAEDHAYGWGVYHSGLSSPETKSLALNTTAAATTNNMWANTLPTSSVFSTTIGGLEDAGYPVIFYCFSSVANYSKFGSYTGTGASGNAITTGFAPAFVMIKNTASAYRWYMLDNTRDPSNPVYKRLFANNSDTESTNQNTIEFTSTGFNIITNDAEINQSGTTMIYAAFADTREYAYWYDQSGNNNDWTSEGGLTESDVMVDSPTNNFCTFNPIDHATGNAGTLSEGNLKFTNDGNDVVRGTLGATSGKWYAEYRYGTSALNNSPMMIGLMGLNGPTAHSGMDRAVYMYSDNNANTKLYVVENGNGTSTNVSGLTGITPDTVLQLAWDVDSGKVWVGKDNTWLNSGNPSGNATPTITMGTSGNNAITIGFDHAGGAYNAMVNCGQDSSFAGNKTPQGNQDANGIGDFYYAPPTGFLSLCSANLPSVDVIPSENFNTVLYTGNATARSITGVGFAPDFTWLKERSSTSSHALYDAVRGVNKQLSSNLTNAEDSSNTNIFTAFNSDGFSVGVNNQTNQSGVTMASWNWKAGGTASSNTNGTITSSVSANASAGFSIVADEANGNVTSRGHGLASAPEMIIRKNRDSARNWAVWHKDLTANYALEGLNTTGAQVSGGNPSKYFRDINSTTFSVGDDVSVNANGDSYISYCFHSVDGFSKVGSYTGNGSADGTFVHCGFKVAMIIQKRTDGADSWHILDNKRSPSNVVDDRLYPNSSSAESTSGDRVDFTSNGFKVRTTNGDFNASGGTYIFIAFAESPFKHTNAR